MLLYIVYISQVSGLRYSCHCLLVCFSSLKQQIKSSRTFFKIFNYTKKNCNNLKTLSRGQYLDNFVFALHGSAYILHFLMVGEGIKVEALRIRYNQELSLYLYLSLI